MAFRLFSQVSSGGYTDTVQFCSETTDRSPDLCERDELQCGATPGILSRGKAARDGELNPAS